MRPENYIVRYLDEVQLMQLATSVENQPWVVSLYFAVDNQHNLYWLSQNTREHSKHIETNPHVAATVHLPYAVGQPGVAVGVKGMARIVPSEEVEAHFQAYAERYNRHAMLPQLLDPTSPHTLYQLQPNEFVLYDEFNFPDNPRQEWTPVSEPNL